MTPRSAFQHLAYRIGITLSDGAGLWPDRILWRLRRAHFCTVIGLFLLLLNALSPALAGVLSDLSGTPAPMMVAAPLSVQGQAETTSSDQVASLQQSLQPGQMVICTPTGLRVITLGPDGTPLAEEDAVREGFCPFSLPLTNGAAQALPLLAALLPAPVLWPQDSFCCEQEAELRPAVNRHDVPPLRGPPTLIL